MRESICLLAAVIVLGATLPVDAQYYRYDIENLGILDGTMVSDAAAVNNYAQATGTSWQGGNYRTYCFSDELGMDDLGTLPAPYNWGSHGTDISDASAVVGYSYMQVGSILLPHAFRHTPGVGMEDLGTLGGDSSYARAVNDIGQVAGDSRVLPDEYVTHIFRYTDGVGMEDLGRLGTSSHNEAHDINNLGQLVGYSGGRAFRYTDGVGFEDLGTLGGTFSKAVGINDLSHVAGDSDTDMTDEFGSSLRRAFFYTDEGGMQELGVLPGTLHSFAVAMNNHDQILGFCLTEVYEMHPFIWTPVAGMVALTPLVDVGENWALGEFTDLNDRGHIVGKGTYWGEGTRGFRLTPTLPADIDFDQDVDLNDYAYFAECYGGADAPPASTCRSGVIADMDFDGDVDLADFATFAESFTG